MRGLFGRRRCAPAAGEHVLITGGSKGLGLELARLYAARGCKVTVVARSQPDLDAALDQLRAAAPAGGAAPPVLQALSADTCDAAKLKRAFEQAEAQAGPIELLICNAGFSVPGLFIEQGPDVFERTMRVNYLGTVNSVQAALPGMLARRSGRVVLVASMLGVLGFAGYCSYAPTKWALRGLADCLRNELQGTGVGVSVAYPPDTDTPGYQVEMESKPALCKAVNSALGSELFPAAKVAGVLVGGIDAGAYHLPSPDVGQNLLVALMTGLSPKRFWLPVHVVLGPVMPLVSSVFAWVADRAARRHNQEHGMPPSK
ncbi:short-chain dehydrogenase [Micractinium conductrix]|uniref:3-dehydrosphinganine reductase n=1 Tax=Micractinium conductrix TaxID=554055 RepID=A0A2P6VA78_9CHLO|nr:short-chain dehydrogenase [Micractinium conductrix]|eukprot:PSC70985.1 short-chain dehydrogenase [Micractinium conductrix]